MKTFSRCVWWGLFGHHRLAVWVLQGGNIKAYMGGMDDKKQQMRKGISNRIVQAKSSSKPLQSQQSALWFKLQPVQACMLA